MWPRGTALVPTLERVAQLTGATHLRNLEASGGLQLSDLLVTASDAILDRAWAEGDAAPGVDPSLYERSVAFQFLGLLSAQNYLRSGDSAEVAMQRYFGLSDRYYAQVRVRRQDGGVGPVRRGQTPRIYHPSGPFRIQPDAP